ncbi:MAG: NAD-dependent epimerase/dehydratase family protein [Candidatus Aminicenantales bacterium]
MKILIIGGSRFVGYHLARYLLEEGHQLTLFNRGQTGDDFGQRVTRLKGDRYNWQQFSGALTGQKFDVVIDMIAFKREDSLAAIKLFSGKVGHFIHISTAAVYAVTKDYPCPLREEDFQRELNPKPAKADELWIYGYQKRQCEEVLQEAYRREKFPVTIFRLPIVIGERDYTLRAYSYIIRIMDGKPLILPDGGMNVFTLIYQADIVRTIASNLLNSSSWGQAYNLAQEEIISLRALVKAISHVLEKKLEMVNIPVEVLKKTPFGLSFSPFTMRRPLILEVRKAKSQLRFKSTPFSVWIANTVHWFKNKYKGEPPQNYRKRKMEIEFCHRYQEAVESII